MSFIPPVLAITANASTTLSGAHKLYQASSSKDCSAAAHLHRGREHLDSAINIVDDSASDLTPQEVVGFSEEHVALRAKADVLEISLPLTESFWCRPTWPRYKRKRHVHSLCDDFEKDSAILNKDVKRSSALAKSKRLVREYGSHATQVSESSNGSSASGTRGPTAFGEFSMTESTVPALQSEPPASQTDISGHGTENIELQVPTVHISLEDVDHQVESNPFSDPRT